MRADCLVVEATGEFCCHSGGGGDIELAVEPSDVGGCCLDSSNVGDDFC